MFSFHKPKIYRSLKGCCICRAKSSSSRFTDSKRYETDFEKCFRIFEKRSGEICNACVLLVKRWKKLPAGSTRNWHHVVDARAGPGTKSIMKMKAKKAEDKTPKKHKHKKKIKHNKPPSSPGGLSDDVVVGDDCQSDNSSQCSSTPVGSDVSDDENDAKTTASSKSRRSKAKPIRFSSFLDLTYWKKTEVCCGIIFKGINGEVLVDTNLLRPCRTCKPTAGSLGSHSEMSSQQSSPRPDSQEVEAVHHSPSMNDIDGLQNGDMDHLENRDMDSQNDDMDLQNGDEDELQCGELDEVQSQEMDDEDDEYEEDDEMLTSQEDSQDSLLKPEDAQLLPGSVLDLSLASRKPSLLPDRSIPAEI